MRGFADLVLGSLEHRLRSTVVAVSGAAMYMYIVRRTQIYLSEELDEVLELMAKASGATKSQLIRDAVEEKYLRRSSRAELLRALSASAGSWRRRESGASYVERMRMGRLARLHAAGRK